MAYYNEFYSRLRKSHYFSDEVKNAIIEKGGEWKIIEKNPGEYAFLQMYYSQSNLGNDLTVPNYTFSGNNPFKKQTAFVRVEPRWSTEYANPVTLCEFDETKTVGSQTIAKTGLSVNMSKNMAVKVSVKGTGKDGDAMLIKMVGDISSGESGGHSAYFVDLNFEGWREIILLDLDSAEYDTDKYQFSGITTSGATYATYRTVANYGKMITLDVLLDGDTASSAQIGNITAYTHTNAPIKNPTIEVGSSKITFNCEMKGGEYIEYDPVTGKAILYHNAEQTTEEVTFSGTLTVPSGTYTAKYSAETQSDAPLRARLVLGFLGQEIGN